jgi:hypothetical protein
MRERWMLADERAAFVVRPNAATSKISAMAAMPVGMDGIWKMKVPIMDDREDADQHGHARVQGGWSTGVWTLSRSRGHTSSNVNILQYFISGTRE